MYAVSLSVYMAAYAEISYISAWAHLIFMR